jgi:hypothetical protein
LRPYKQMIRHYNITLIQSNMDSDTSETWIIYSSDKSKRSFKFLFNILNQT